LYPAETRGPVDNNDVQTLLDYPDLISNQASTRVISTLNYPDLNTVDLSLITEYEKPGARKLEVLSEIGRRVQRYLSVLAATSRQDVQSLTVIARLINYQQFIRANNIAPAEVVADDRLVCQSGRSNEAIVDVASLISAPFLGLDPADLPFDVLGLLSRVEHAPGKTFLDYILENTSAIYLLRDFQVYLPSLRPDIFGTVEELSRTIIIDTAKTKLTLWRFAAALVHENGHIDYYHENRERPQNLADSERYATLTQLSFLRALALSKAYPYVELRDDYAFYSDEVRRLNKELGRAEEDFAL